MDSRQRSVLTRDCFGRVICTHQCPQCGGRFLSAAMCRPCHANGFAHPEEVEALPIIGCTPPPDQTWAIALHVLVKAPTEEKAYEMGRNVIERQFPKRVVERYGNRFFPVPLNTRMEAMRVDA